MADEKQDPTLPTHSNSAPNQGGGERLLDQGQLQEHTAKPYADLTVDSEPDHARTIPYDPTIHERTKPTLAEIDPASWDDLRALSAPPPANSGPGSGMTVFVCIQHPQMIVMDGDRVVGKFQRGYLSTDDPRLIKLLSNPRQRYVKRLDMSKVGS